MFLFIQLLMPYHDNGYKFNRLCKSLCYWDFIKYTGTVNMKTTIHLKICISLSKNKYYIPS